MPGSSTSHFPQYPSTWLKIDSGIPICIPGASTCATTLRHVPIFRYLSRNNPYHITTATSYTKTSATHMASAMRSGFRIGRSQENHHETNYPSPHFSKSGRAPTTDHLHHAIYSPIHLAPLSHPPHFQALPHYIIKNVYSAQHNPPPARLSRLHILTHHPGAVSPAILRLPQVLVRYFTTLPNDDRYPLFHAESAMYAWVTTHCAS